MKLLNWVELNKIMNNFGLLCNPNAIHLLKQNIHKLNLLDQSVIITNNTILLYEQIHAPIESESIEGNIKIFYKNLINKSINWYGLSSHPNAIHLLEQNIDKIHWGALSSNPNAIHLLEQNINKISWFELSRNPNAIHLLEQNIDKISWCELSCNPNVSHILEKNKKI